MPPIRRAVKDVFVVAAKRTPFGAFGGKIAQMTATDLQEVAARSCLETYKIDPKIIQHAVIGIVFAAKGEAAYIGRHTAARLGIPVSVPGLIVGRNCASGFQSIITACQEIMLGDCDIVLTGGTDTMSFVPHTIHNFRFGVGLGKDLTVEDYVWQTLCDSHINSPMGITAENLAEKYNISREESDGFALRSQQRWKAAHDAGIFTDETAPITLKTKKGEQLFDTDEHPRPDVKAEKLAKLPTVFKKGGVVTAGNASGIADGAGCVIVANEEACKRHNLKPLVRIAGYSISGCDPHIMGIGPVSAIQHTLKKTGKSLQDMDLVEVNEAFAPQYLACEKELDLDPAKTNVNGGAIAIGHPLGASGSRITTHLVHALKRTGSKYAMGSACCGGGQGVAIMLENVD